MTSRHLFALLFCSVITLGCDKENIPEGTVKDADGNVYHTIVIDSQLWMLENLKTTRYNDGTPIIQITDNQIWDTLTIPAYCWHGNNPENKESYGALYNWHVVKTGKICPAGWHVPTYEDWMALSTYVQNDGGRLKEQGTTHWTFPNSQANNATGFTALPGSFRGFNGRFGELGVSGYWWSDGPYNGYWGVATGLYHNDFLFDMRSTPKLFGMSVRCVRDAGTM